MSDARRCCTRCGETKPLEAFPRCGHGRRHRWCRPCKTAHDVAYQQAKRAAFIGPPRPHGGRMPKIREVIARPPRPVSPWKWVGPKRPVGRPRKGAERAVSTPPAAGEGSR